MLFYSSNTTATLPLSFETKEVAMLVASRNQVDIFSGRCDLLATGHQTTGKIHPTYCFTIHHTNIRFSLTSYLALYTRTVWGSPNKYIRVHNYPYFYTHIYTPLIEWDRLPRYKMYVWHSSWPKWTVSYKAGAEPGFLKGGGVHLRSTSKKRGVQEGVQFWAQC